MSQVHTNSGIFMRRHARRAQVEDRRDDVDRAHDRRGAQDVDGEDRHVDRDALLDDERRIERPARGGGAAGHEERGDAAGSRRARASQKLQLFMRGNAMSAAPICIGMSQFANPTNAGMIAPKTITRPCTVVRELKNSGLRNCSPGWKSSARMSSAIVPPMKNMMSENHEVHRADVLVVGRVEPAREPRRVARARGRRDGRGRGRGRLQHSWVNSAFSNPVGGLLAGGLDLGGLDGLAGLVAPGISRVRDDGGELAVGEPREGRHRRARLAVRARARSARPWGRSRPWSRRGPGRRAACPCPSPGGRPRSWRCRPRRPSP